MAKKKSVNLSVGRGEKRSVKQGGGLTAKGRAKYNRATGSKLKAPVTGKLKLEVKMLREERVFVLGLRVGQVQEGKLQDVGGNVN